MMPRLRWLFICFLTILAASGHGKNGSEPAPESQGVAAPAPALEIAPDEVASNQEKFTFHPYSFEAGKKIVKFGKPGVVSSKCSGCHGINGIATSPKFPNLAGQKINYLIATMRAFKSGQRKHPIMSGVMVRFSIIDIQNVATYYASQPIKKPSY